MLTVATQAEADDAELNPDQWTFLECKYAEGWPRKIVTGENSPIPFLLAVSKDKTSVIEMENDWHFNDCRTFRHSYLECSGNSTKYNISINRYTAEMFLRDLSITRGFPIARVFGIVVSCRNLS